MTEKEKLKENMEEASDRIIDILSEYDFTTIQGTVILSYTSKAIRQAQGEKSGKGMIEDERED